MRNMKAITSLNNLGFNPNALTAQLFNDSIDNWFKPASYNDNIPVNISETDTAFAIQLVVPGYTKEEIGIELDNGKLSIVSKAQETSTDEGVKLHKKEFEKATFSKQFKLPKSVDVSKIEAKQENGILELVLAKKEEEIPTPVKQIEIG